MFTHADFPCYSEQELKQYKVSGRIPESMTVPSSPDLVKIERMKKRLINEKDVFFISTQKVKPNHRFKEGSKYKIEGPFVDGEFQCLFKMEYIYKGFRMVGYMCQYI